LLGQACRNNKPERSRNPSLSVSLPALYTFYAFYTFYTFLYFFILKIFGNNLRTQAMSYKDDILQPLFSLRIVDYIINTGTIEQSPGIIVTPLIITSRADCRCDFLPIADTHSPSLHAANVYMILTQMESFIEASGSKLSAHT
jgi:hypothetical protein